MDKVLGSAKKGCVAPEGWQRPVSLPVLNSQKKSGVWQLREGDGRGEAGEERADFAGPWGMAGQDSVEKWSESKPRQAPSAFAHLSSHSEKLRKHLDVGSRIIDFSRSGLPVS